MGVTTIEWADYTFNAWMGCTKVGPGCEFCYAEDLANYRGWAKWGNDAPRVRTAESTWKQPLTWNRAAARDGTRPFVFTNSLADVFDNKADPQWRADLFALMRATPHLIWLPLTKRIGNADAMIEVAGGLPPNAALGATMVNQEEVDRDTPKLLHTAQKHSPAFVFVSLEPLLGMIDLRSFMAHGWYGDIRRGVRAARIEQVITGGESGRHARPPEPNAIRSLRDQCAATRTPFLFKQWGEWAPVGAHETMKRVGKAAAGRTLDGVEHLARPFVPPLPPAAQAPTQASFLGAL